MNLYSIAVQKTKNILNHVQIVSFNFYEAEVLMKKDKFEYTREFPKVTYKKVIWYLQKLIDPLNTENLLCPKAVANQRLSPRYLVHLCPQFIIRAVQS